MDSVAVNSAEAIYEQILDWTKTQSWSYGEAALIQLQEYYDNLDLFVSTLDTVAARLDANPRLPRWSAWLRFVKGRALRLAGRTSDALKAFELVVSEYSGQEELILRHSVAGSLYGMAEAQQQLGDDSAKNASIQKLIHWFSQASDPTIQNETIRPLLSNEKGQIIINGPAQHALGDSFLLNQTSAPLVHDVPDFMGAGRFVKNSLNWILRKWLQPRADRANKEWAARVAAIAHSSHLDAMKVLEQHRQDGKPFALYLRSFDIESQSGLFSCHDGMHQARVHHVANDFEGHLTTRCKPSVALIGISNPYASIGQQQRGCPKIEVLQETWRAVILELIERASFIIIQLSDASGGVAYELDALCLWGRQDSTILVKFDQKDDDIVRSILQIPNASPSTTWFDAQNLQSFPYKVNESEFFLDDAEASLYLREQLTKAEFVASLPPEERIEPARLEELYREHLRSQARLSSESAEFYRRAILYQKAGDTIIQHSHGENALRSYFTALAILQALIGADPRNIRYLADLSVLHEHVGDLLRAIGRLDEALDQYWAAINVSESLAAVDPKSSGRHGVLVCYGRIGDVLVDRGDLHGSLAQWQSARVLAAELVAEEPQTVQWRHYLSGSLNRIGGLQFALGEVVEAIANYRASQTILEGLTTADPANLGWQRDLAFTYKKLGMIFAETGNFQEALQTLQEGKRLMQHLAASSSSDIWTAELEKLDHRIATLTHPR
jgi:tetratricopeptide (TPR) repeat protein